MVELAVGSLFSGIGGFDLGFERAGLRIAWQCEIDPRAASVLTTHWPTVPNIGDVHDVTRGAVPPVDLLCGGFPCQDVSVAGRRAGLAGARSGLWWEFHRILGELRPRWVVIENVPGLLSSHRGGDMGAVLWTLGELGYGWAYRIIDAQYFGVAQRRRRVFIVGHLGDGTGRLPAKVLFDGASLQRDPPARQPAKPEVASNITQGFGARRGAGLMDSGQIVACPLTSREAKGPASDATSGNLVTHALTREGHDASEDGTGGGVPLVVVKATKSHGPDEYERWEGADTALTLDAAGHSPRTATAVFSVSPESGQGASLSARQVKAGEPAPTLNGTDEAARTNRGARIVDAVGVRRLTPRECERLQGFPDDWTRYDPIDRELADSPRYRMLGNAVAVPIAEWIGRRIVSVGGPGRQSRRPG